MNKHLINSNEVKFMYYFLDIIIVLCSIILLVFFYIVFFKLYDDLCAKKIGLILSKKVLDEIRCL